jgi:hypothetical protein
MSRKLSGNSIRPKDCAKRLVQKIELFRADTDICERTQCSDADDENLAPGTWTLPPVGGVTDSANP